MKPLSNCTDEELVTIAQKSAEKFSKAIADARKIADEYGFSITESENNILNIIFVKLKEKRDEVTKETIEPVYQNALASLSKRGEYAQIQMLLTLFQEGDYQGVKAKLQELNFFQERPTKNSRPPQGEKTAKTCLRVSFPDGTIICQPKSADTMEDVIDRIGPEKVAELGIRMSGRPLVSKERYDTYERGQHEISNGWFVTTHSSTTEKVRRLKQISAALGLNLKVEEVERDLVKESH
jgi:hypothetical protein